MASGAILPKTGLQKLAAGDTLAETDINPIMDAAEANAGSIEAINVMSWTFATSTLNTIQTNWSSLLNRSVRLIEIYSGGPTASAGGIAYKHNANNGKVMLLFGAYAGIYCYKLTHGTWTEEHIT